MTDGNTSHAVLVGPTQLTFFQGKVFFTDRRVVAPPNFPTVVECPTCVFHAEAAVRVWDIVGGSVTTLTSSPHQRSLSFSGVSAAWGLSVQSSNLLVFGEADTNLLKMISPSLNATNATDRVLCPMETFLKDGKCIECGSEASRRKPVGTRYTGMNCTWTCPMPPESRPFTCPEISASFVLPGNASLASSSSEVGLDVSAMFVCNPGFSKTSDMNACEVCPLHYYCTGMNWNGVGKRQCPGSSLSVIGSDSLLDCGCPLGYFSTASESEGMVSCEVCMAGAYCPPDGLGGSLQPVYCVGNTTSVQGKTNVFYSITHLK